MIQPEAKILIVDDRSENIHALKTVLEPLKAEIISALSGNDALSLLLQHEFALVLLDVQMPEMDGFETATLMQNNEATRGVPIIFLTAINKEQKHIFKGYETGAVDYIFKPFDADILLSKVQVFINLYKMRIANTKLQEELMRARNLEALGIVAGGIAHDFNNLLTMIIGNVELAQEDFKQNSRSSEFLEEALHASNQAVELTNKLISFSKGGQLTKELTSLQELIDSTGKKIFNESDIEFNLEARQQLWPISVDRFQIEQVFTNIFKNAREALGSKGRVAVTIENYTNESPPLPIAPGSYLKITVTDSGPGIPEEILHKVFAPYFSTKNLNTNKGQGMGLALCHSIVSKHNGLITADSDYGTGASFTIYLPAGLSTPEM